MTESEIRLFTPQENLLEVTVQAAVDSLEKAEAASEANDAEGWENELVRYQGLMHQAEVQLRLVVDKRMKDRRAEPKEREK